MHAAATRPVAAAPKAAAPRRVAAMAAKPSGAACSDRASPSWWQQLPQPATAAAVGCLAALLLSAPMPVAAKEVIQGLPKVVDGDTLDFSGTRVRLFGIDAPETKQSCTAAKGGEYMCGERSKQALLEKIGKATVQCEQKNRDKYGRVVGICSLARAGGDSEDLNAWMVQQGLAVAYRQYSKAYVPLEEEAKAAQRGIWSGSFELPQQWRIEHPRGGKAAGASTSAATAVLASAVPVQPSAAAKPAAAGGCAIKGNITAKGEKIYHVPGGAFYERTVIEEDKGERFFCTAAEAEAAGWRASSK